MKISRNAMTLAVVAGIAFVVGRADLFDAGTSVATAGPLQDEPPPDMMAKMEAMMAAGTPGKHHRVMDQFVGEWEAIVSIRQEPGMPMMEMSAKVSREWVLDGHFLQETVTSESEWGVFSGLGFTGFNNVEGLYEMVWMDTTATMMTMDTATYDSAAKMMRTRGTQRDPVTGKLVPTRGETDMSSPDRHVYRGYMIGPDGAEYLNFEGVFERAK